MKSSLLPKRLTNSTPHNLRSQMNTTPYVNSHLTTSVLTKSEQRMISKRVLAFLTLSVLVGLSFTTGDSLDPQFPTELTPYVSMMLNTSRGSCPPENTFLIEQLFNK